MEAKPKSAHRAFFFDQALPPCVIKVGRYSVELLNWGRIAPHRWQNPVHSHSFFELCYISQGAGRYTFKGQRQRVSRGDLVIAYPGEEHSLKAEPGNPLGIYCASLGIYSGSGQAEGSQVELSAMIQRFLESGKRMVRNPQFEAIGRMVSAEVLEQELGYELSLAGLFTKMFFNLLNAFCRVAHAPHGVPVHRAHPQDSRLRKAVLMVENHFHSPLQVGAIAGCMCVSERQANRLFRQFFGMPVMKFIQDYRLKMARQMLDNTSRPIKEIAWACGYPNERNFMTVFRRHAGVTATRFRYNRRNGK